MIEEIQTEQVQSEQIYPSVSERVKALVMDGFIYLVFMITVSFIFSLFNDVPAFAKAITITIFVMLYDPIMTSKFGGTLGHMMAGIRVKRAEKEDLNINFPTAVLRFAIKLIFGWLSLLTVTASERHKAIHDYLSGSIVIYQD